MHGSVKSLDSLMRINPNPTREQSVMLCLPIREEDIESGLLPWDLPLVRVFHIQTERWEEERMVLSSDCSRQEQQTEIGVTSLDPSKNLFSKHQKRLC